MNNEIIATTILVGSLLGIGIVILRKIPVLVELPKTPAEFNLKENLLKLKEKISTLHPFKYFSDKIFLQKILSKIRILTLKTENKTDNWLQKLREKSQKKKFEENDNYWEEVKKSTNKENKNLPR